MTESRNSIYESEHMQTLVGKLIAGYDSIYGYGSMSSAIYDTAWVSMVSKELSGRRIWLFPECFHYILDHQRDDGSWESYASDGILSTAASLLSLTLHLNEPRQIEDISIAEIKDRSKRATAALQARLHTWDVSTTEHVGFEILVPAMLRLLRKEGYQFEFAGESLLHNVLGGAPVQTVLSV